MDLIKLLRAPEREGSGGFAKKLVIITAPSGAGKTSITHYLLQNIPALSFSISAATRRPRKGEVSGRDYYFMSPEEFNSKIKANDFLEWEMVYEGKYYGTLRSEIDRLWGLQKYPLLDIDVKGAIHVQQQYPESSLSIFIQAPSIDELQKRLQSRGTETAQSLAARVNKASYELSFKNHFNKIIINDQLQRACTEAESIVAAFISR